METKVPKTNPVLDRMKFEKKCVGKRKSHLLILTVLMFVAAALVFSITMGYGASLSGGGAGAGGGAFLEEAFALSGESAGDTGALADSLFIVVVPLALGAIVVQSFILHQIKSELSKRG